MEKSEILDAIRASAAANGGTVPGRARFERETGIRQADCLGTYWARWGDAVREAGFEPNKLQPALPEGKVLSSLASLARELGSFPTVAEMRLRRRVEPSFPSHNVFSRFGNRADLARRLAAHCAEQGELDDVVAICEAIADPVRDHETGGARTVVSTGVVYLMKSGQHYKIGRSNSAGRRAYELAIQLPEKLTLVHAIETDDPPGIERYWHDRFADRRLNGEWFALTKADVAAFRRRRQFM